jgi:hypothetical protein
VAEIPVLAQLGEAFQFTPDDIKNNRNRRLSLMQHQRLWREFGQTVIIGLALLFVPMLVGGAIIMFSASGSFTEHLFSLPGMIGIFTGLALMSFYSFANARKLALGVDLVQSANVESITGKVQRQGQYLKMGRLQFLVEGAKLDLIQSGLRYTFYYLPTSGQIVGVEFAE